MVLLNDVDDLTVESMFEREINPFLDVRHMMSALIVGARSSCGLRSKFMFSVKYSGFTSFPTS